jgi:hypothetical protein
MNNSTRPTIITPTPQIKYWFVVTNTNGINSIIWRESWALADVWREIYLNRGLKATEVTDSEMPKPLKRR